MSKESKLKRAKSMDDVLRDCNAPSQRSIISYSDLSQDEHEYLFKTCELLKGKGYLNIYMSSDSISVGITNSGKHYVEMGNSFIKEIKHQEEIERRALIASEVNEKALAAAKREPWIILWGIISTLAFLYLGYLQIK